MMKTKVWISILLLLVLVGCKSYEGGAAQTAATEATTMITEASAEARAVRFEIVEIADLTDAEGRTLHLGAGPNDFYGTIPGEYRGLHGEDPCWLSFQVPYSESYTFTTEGDHLTVLCSSGTASTLSALQNTDVIWRQSSWQLSRAADFEIMSLSGYASCTATCHGLDGALIRLEMKRILLTGVEGPLTLRLRNHKGLFSEPIECSFSGDEVTVDWSDIENGSVRILSGETEEVLPILWQPE